MIILDWLPASVRDYIVNSWMHVINFKTLVVRALLEIPSMSIQIILPAWLRDFIHEHFLNLTYRLNRIEIIIQRFFERICLVLRSLWSIDAFRELLSLQLDHLEHKYSQSEVYEYNMRERFEGSMNYLLACTTRICLRDVYHVPDLYAHICDLVEFVQLLYISWTSAVRYIRAKRMIRMTMTWIRVVSMMYEDRAGVFEHRE